MYFISFNIDIFIHMYVYMYMYVCIHTYIYIYIYVHTYHTITCYIKPSQPQGELGAAEPLPAGQRHEVAVRRVLPKELLEVST